MAGLPTEERPSQQELCGGVAWGSLLRRGTKPGTFPGEMLSQEGNRVFMCRGVPQQHGKSFLNLRRAVEAWDHCDLGLFFFFLNLLLIDIQGVSWDMQSRKALRH